MILSAGLFVFVVSCLLVGALYRYALAKNLIDNPNERSSHNVPTPRGGGLAIVLAFFMSLLILAGKYNIDYLLLVCFIGSGVLVALIGFIDDHQHIAARWRLLAHFIAAIWVLYWLRGLPSLSVIGVPLDVMWLNNILALLYLVWLLNLYNFMDGINGLASIEAITVCLGAIVLYWVVEISDVWVIPALLSIAVLGFLFWNFPRAKIFMGDVGSGFIGIVLGILSIQAAWVASELFWSWIILLGAFIIDATVTLIRRIVRGEKYFEAHRSHAYQYAARKFTSHTKVTLAFAIINLVWLLPIAILVGMKIVDGFLGVIIAYIPLFFLAIYFKAGAKELQEN